MITEDNCLELMEKILLTCIKLPGTVCLEILMFVSTQTTISKNTIGLDKKKRRKLTKIDWAKF